MKQIIKKLAKAGRGKEMVWRYGYNLKPTVKYKFDSHNEPSSESEKRILADLNRNGIAVADVDSLLPNDSCFGELSETVSVMLAERDAELRELKAKANDESEVGKKTFNVELLGRTVTFEPESVFARFALQSAFLNIADAYLGMQAKLRYYNAWFTFATQSAARESQLWHFDREDNYILKVFLYLKDVDEGAGPFTYAPKTHRKGVSWSKQPEYTMEGNVQRSTDEQMAAVVPKENWVRAVGRKGTIIFADTRGYHKGGEAKTDDRLMFTFMFTSPASQSERLIQYPKPLDLSQLSERQKAALQTT
jgi:hypothetical protein